MTEAYNDFTGRRADGHRVKSIVPQFDGSRYASDNCAAASEAARIIRHRQGKSDIGTPWPPTGASIRAATGDTHGGLTAHQTANVAQNVYRVPSDIRIVAWSELVAWLRKGGNATVLVGYGPISPSGSPGFRGNHSIPACGVQGSGSGIKIKSGDPLYDGRRSGIPEGPQWLSISMWKRAASALELSPGRSMGSYYPGKVYVSFGLRTYTPPADSFRLYPGATKLRKPRIYTPTRKVYMRKTPRLVSTNHIGTVQPGFHFEAYQYIINKDGKWIGNKTGTAWLFFAAVKFVRYI